MSFRQTLIKEKLKIRNKVIYSIRKFFCENDYMEVETPIRIPAPAPEENIEAESSGSWFLQTSPELCMKRLLAAGYERIFQFAKCFRRSERGSRHVPEFTLLEWYALNADYFEMMNSCEKLITFVASELGLKDTFFYGGAAIDLTLPWQRMTVSEAFEEFGSLSVNEALDLGRFDEIMALEIEPALDPRKPIFLYDYPLEKGALARRKMGGAKEKLPVAERFELYMGGLELCNAFSELTDRKEQTNRFLAEQEARKRAGRSVYPMPDKFLIALDSISCACGNALGIDRLVMLFTDSDNIDEVMAFTPEEL